MSITYYARSDGFLVRNPDPSGTSNTLVIAASSGGGTAFDKLDASRGDPGVEGGVGSSSLALGLAAVDSGTIISSITLNKKNDLLGTSIVRAQATNINPVPGNNPITLSPVDSTTPWASGDYYSLVITVQNNNAHGGAKGITVNLGTPTIGSNTSIVTPSAPTGPPTVTTTDSENLTDSITLAEVEHQTSTDNENLTDSITTTQTNRQTNTDTESLTDSAVVAIEKLITQTDPENLTDSITLAQTEKQNTTDSENLTDSITLAEAEHQNSTDSEALTDSQTFQDFYEPSDSESLTDSVIAQIVQPLTQDSTDTENLTDSITLDLSAAPIINNTDNEALTDPVAFDNYYENQNNLDLTDPVAVALAFSQLIQENENLTDTLAMIWALAQNSVDDLDLTDSEAVALNFGGNLESNNDLTDSATVTLTTTEPQLITLNAETTVALTEIVSVDLFSPLVTSSSISDIARSDVLTLLGLTSSTESNVDLYTQTHDPSVANDYWAELRMVRDNLENNDSAPFANPFNLPTTEQQVFVSSSTVKTIQRVVYATTALIVLLIIVGLVILL